MNKNMRNALSWVLCIVFAITVLALITLHMLRALFSRNYAEAFFDETGLANVTLPLGNDGVDITIARLIANNLPEELESSDYDFSESSLHNIIRRSELDSLVINAITNAGEYLKSGRVIALYSESDIIELLESESDSIRRISGGYTVDSSTNRLIEDLFDKSADRYDTMPELTSALGFDIDSYSWLTSTWLIILLAIVAAASFSLLYMLNRKRKPLYAAYWLAAMIAVGAMLGILYAAITVMISSLSINVLSAYTSNAKLVLLILSIVFFVVGIASSILLKLVPQKQADSTMRSSGIGA